MGEGAQTNETGARGRSSRCSKWRLLSSSSSFGSFCAEQRQSRTEQQCPEQQRTEQQHPSVQLQSAQHLSRHHSVRVVLGGVALVATIARARSARGAVVRSGPHWQRQQPCHVRALLSGHRASPSAQARAGTLAGGCGGTDATAATVGGDVNGCFCGGGSVLRTPCATRNERISSSNPRAPREGG